MICLMLISQAGVLAQDHSGMDSARRHEFFVSVLPVLIPLAGGYYDNQVNFQAGYRHYTKKGVVLRSAVSIFPNANQSFFGGMPIYNRRVGNRNVFVSYLNGGGIKSQLTLGAEKIFRVKRLQHGFGVDLFFNHKYANRAEIFRYQPDSGSVMPHLNDTTDYTVDSLGYQSWESHAGVGMQVFYSIRFRLSKRFYISSTIGPSFNFALVRGRHYDHRTKKENGYNGTSFDFPNVPLISDISICFRF